MKNQPPEQVLIYDLNSLPDESTGLTANDILKLYKEANLVLYSSFAIDGTKAEKPQVVNVKDIEVTFVDLSKQENMKKLNNYKSRLK